MLTQERLKEVLHYDPDTGAMTARIDRVKVRAGSVLGSPNSKGYLMTGIDYVVYGCHHLAWLYTHGEMPSEIDHINLNPADNRLINLRPCTHSQNMANRAVLKTSTTGLKGVTKTRGGKWGAEISMSRVRHWLGTFDTPEQAAAAYDKAARELHGEFAYTNS